MTRDFVEGIFTACKDIYKDFIAVRGCSYMKAICLMKEQWVTYLEIFDQLNYDKQSNVSRFVKNLRVHLQNLRAEELHTVFYLGETSQTFEARMSKNDPREFLSLFPATHIFKLSQVKAGTNMAVIKRATYAMESFMAIWWDIKMKDCVTPASGRFINIAVCGYRAFFGGRQDMAHPTYVSYELDSNKKYVPLMVHNTWDDVNRTYGQGSESMYCTHVSDNDSYVQHFRVKDIHTSFLYRARC